MDIVTLIIQLVAGAVGGNDAGAAVKQNSLGTIGNSIAGIFGGGIGGQILGAVRSPASPRQASTGTLDIGSTGHRPGSSAVVSAAASSWSSSASSNRCSPAARRRSKRIAAPQALGARFTSAVEAACFHRRRSRPMGQTNPVETLVGPAGFEPATTPL